MTSDWISKVCCHHHHVTWHSQWQCDNVHRSLSLIYLWLRDYFLACAHSYVGSSHWSSSYKEIEDAENEDKWTINDGCSANWSHVFVAWQHGNQLVMATLSAHQATEVRVQSGHASCFLLPRTCFWTMHYVNQSWLVMEKGGDFCLDYILSGATWSFIWQISIIFHIYTQSILMVSCPLSVCCVRLCDVVMVVVVRMSVRRMSWFLVLKSVMTWHMILC